jgi:hypothetical protein
MAMPRSGLNAAQQAFALRGRFPDGRGQLKSGRLRWTFVLKPTPLSRSYRIQIEYGPRGQPRVRVLEDLETLDGKSLPHTYSDGTLCLHEVEEWTSAMSIADTIVPWTAEWLAHYEIWLITGEWHGGGVWPPRRMALADEGGKAPPDANA